MGSSREREPVLGHGGAFSFFLSLGAGETSGSVRWPRCLGYLEYLKFWRCQVGHFRESSARIQTVGAVVTGHTRQYFDSSV